MREDIATKKAAPLRKRGYKLVTFTRNN